LIEGAAMPVDNKGFTREEIREFMHEYYLQPHGTRKEWLASTSVSAWTFRRWRTLMVQGDIDRGLIPREHGGMVPTNRELSAFEKARAKEIAAHRAEVEKLQKRVQELEDTNSALGKAIGLLHELSVPEPDTTPTSAQNGS
jgi:DNA-binding transcriptional MerR regulator